MAAGRDFTYAPLRFFAACTMVGPQRLDKGASDRLAADRAESPSVAWRRECLASLLRTMGEVPEYLPRSLDRMLRSAERMGNVQACARAQPVHGRLVGRPFDPRRTRTEQIRSIFVR